MKYIKNYVLFESSKLNKEKIVQYSNSLFGKNKIDAPTLIYAILDDFIEVEDAKDLIPKLDNVNTICNLKLYELGVFDKFNFAKHDSYLKYIDGDVYIEFSFEGLKHFIKSDDQKSIERIIYFEWSNSWYYYHKEIDYYFKYSWDDFSDDVIQEIKEKMIDQKIDLSKLDVDEEVEYTIKEEDFEGKKIKINDKELDIVDVIIKCNLDNILTIFSNAYSEAKESACASEAFNSVMDEIEKKIGPFKRNQNDDFVFDVFKMVMKPSWVLKEFEEENGQFTSQVVSGKTVYNRESVNYDEDIYGSYKNTLYEYIDRQDLIEYNEPYYGWDSVVDKDYLNEIFENRLRWD